MKTLLETVGQENRGATGRAGLRKSRRRAAPALSGARGPASSGCGARRRRTSVAAWRRRPEGESARCRALKTGRCRSWNVAPAVRAPENAALRQDAGDVARAGVDGRRVGRVDGDIGHVDARSRSSPSRSRRRSRFDRRRRIEIRRRRAVRFRRGTRSGWTGPAAAREGPGSREARRRARSRCRPRWRCGRSSSSRTRRACRPAPPRGSWSR